MIMDMLIYLAPACALVGLLFAAFSLISIKKEDEGDEVVKKITAAIHGGAMVYLNILTASWPSWETPIW